MNRYRINQILDVLLFPFSDPDLQVRDPLLEKYLAYRDFVDLDLSNISMIGSRAEKSAKYREADRRLIRYLASRSTGRIKSYDDLLMLCELYYPLLELERTMERIQRLREEAGASGEKRDNIALFYLNNLARLSASFLTYRDGVAAVRTWNNSGDGIEDDLFRSAHVFDKVELWNILCRFVVPDIFIAMFAVESGLDETALYEQRPYISLADKLLIKSLKKGMAENHLHFNAGFDYETVWLNRMNLAVMDEKTSGAGADGGERHLTAAVFRFLAARFLEEGHCERMGFAPWIRELSNGEFAGILYPLYTGGRLTEKDRLLAGRFCAELAGRLPEGTDYLMDTVYQAHIELKTSSELLLLFQCCAYIKKRPWDTGFAAVFLQYLRIKNHYFQQTQQRYRMPGLRHFQEYFDRAKAGEAKAAGKGGMALDVFRSQAKMACLKKLEIRIAPDVSAQLPNCFDGEASREIIKPQLYRQLYNILYLYRRYIFECILGVGHTRAGLKWEEDQMFRKGFSFHDLQNKVYHKKKAALDGLSVPSLGIVYHFIKSENLDNVSGYFCWRRVNDAFARYSGHRLFSRQMMVNVAVAIEEIRGAVPKLSEYIVGVDAASDENAMEPWMFAPAYNRMRTKSITKPVMERQKDRDRSYCSIQNIGFTYHVGEDFRHILSGLRHIDEVIEEFHYKPGDRLGHAIALGLNVDKWAKDNEAIPIPVKEHMENLLWMWGKNVVEGVILPIQLEMLEHRIMDCAMEIYGETNGISVRMLYQAYKDKFLFNHKEKLEALLKIPGKSGCRPQVHCCYSEEACDINKSPWTADRLLCTNYCPVFEDRGSRVRLVSVPENEVGAYKALQEDLLYKVEQRGIYVETNPTSNVTIGDFDDLFEHPIFRMNSLTPREPGAHHVLVTVNSDDPAVFNTNVENELSYIYYAVERGGYAKEDVLLWLDKVRQNGLDASFVQRVKRCPVILEEIGGILDDLRTRF